MQGKVSSFRSSFSSASSCLGNFQSCVRRPSLANDALEALLPMGLQMGSAGGPSRLEGAPCRSRAWAARDCSTAPSTTRLHSAPPAAVRPRAGLIEQRKSTKASRAIPAGITQGEAN